ncbi:hypothetical protein BR10RB9215_C10734 [Brucella sp. 10RB9215]|nr:hypothetical protein BR10RB9215_C10734 [Brucella sp. 10RB9215]
MLKSFARKARERIRLEDGGYRRDHLRSLAQRVEVDDAEARIMGSKSELLRTLVAAASRGKSAAFGVHSSVLKWRTRQDSNLWPLPSEGRNANFPKIEINYITLILIPISIDHDYPLLPRIAHLCYLLAT